MKTPSKKFGGFSKKTLKERAQRAEERKWADKSGPVETRRQTIEEYMDWLTGLSPEQYEKHLKDSEDE